MATPFIAMEKTEPKRGWEKSLAENSLEKPTYPSIVNIRPPKKGKLYGKILIKTIDKMVLLIPLQTNYDLGNKPKH